MLPPTDTMRVLVLAALVATTYAQLSNLPGLSTAQTDGTSAVSSAPSGTTNPPASNTPASSGGSSPSPGPSTTAPSPSTDSSAPALTSLSGLPSIAGAGIPTMVVPDTANAPFMQKSNLPEGTVFICVGAILGFLGASVLAWRGLVAWSLHRSVKKAAMQQDVSDSKAMLRPPGAGFYSTVPHSALSLDHLTSPGKVPKNPKTPTPSGNLFFSPTAGAGLHTAGNRNSSYLPAGYYAAGNSAPAGGNAMTHIGGTLSGIGPQHAGYHRAQSSGPSPPGSPGLPPSLGGDGSYGRPSTSGLYAEHSQSSLNLNAPPQGRAPSAYLEDLFENHGNGPRERF